MNKIRNKVLCVYLGTSFILMKLYDESSVHQRVQTQIEYSSTNVFLRPTQNDKELNLVKNTRDIFGLTGDIPPQRRQPTFILIAPNKV